MVEQAKAEYDDLVAQASYIAVSDKDVKAAEEAEEAKEAE